MKVQQYRQRQLRELTDEIGVYALCDLDRVPIYVGQSTDGIRARVRRHLTSARSDMIANRQIDVWEVAFVFAYPVPQESEIELVEQTLFHKFDRQSRLLNGKVLPKPSASVNLPDPQVVQVLPEGEIERRKEPFYRLPRQAQQVSVLLDYILETADKTHLRRSLHAHYERLDRYYRDFQSKYLPKFE